MYSVLEICEKDVVTLRTGTKLGRVDDVNFTKETATIDSFVVFGKSKFFGLFGREPDMTIPYKDVVNIGKDVILVRYEPPKGLIES